MKKFLIVIVALWHLCNNSQMYAQGLTINCPSNVTVAATPGLCGKYVNYLVPTGTQTGAQDVPTGYAYAGFYNGNYYYLSNSSKTWTEARDDAESAGGHLVTIVDNSENDFVNHLRGVNAVWTGIS